MIMNLYSGFRFLFELLCIVIAGYLGFNYSNFGNWRFILGVLAPLAIILVWSVWGVPSSPRRLQGLLRLALKLGTYGISAILLYNTSFKSLIGWFILIGITNACINYFVD